MGFERGSRNAASALFLRRFSLFLMRFRAHSIRRLLTLSLMAVFVSVRGASQNTPVLQPASATHPAAISRVRVILSEDFPAVEITSTRPVVPTIEKQDDPLRLIITLANANISVPNKQIKVNSKEISGIDLDRQLALHIGSHQLTPATVRLVVHLSEPCSYTWDATGNRLMVHLHRETQQAAAKPPTTASLTNVNEPVAVPLSAVNSGKVVLASLIPSGASITATKRPVILRLARGGEVQVCPGTSVVLTRAQEGSDLMLGMGTGAIETHYALESSTDSILTPDFRIFLRGPGEFHYAISADPQGNTCVRELPGNTAPATVSELMGEGVYNLKLGEQVAFHNGRVDTADAKLPAHCGCAVATPPGTELASTVPDENTKLASLNMPPTGDPPAPVQAQVQPQAATQPERASAVTVTAANQKPETVQLEVAAPLVYRATPAPASPAPDAKNMPLAYSAPPAAIAPQVPAPATTEPPAASKPKHGFFGKIKRAMVKIFS
jgi:hypothetical protein